MNNDRIIELLEIIIKSFETERSLYKTGICNELLIMYANEVCTCEEYKELRSFLAKHKPNSEKYKEFFHTVYWVNDGYWWYPIKRYPETKQIRINFLKMLINNLK